MLRIDRTNLPQLPRPVYEVQAYWGGRDLVIFAMAGMGWHCEGEEFDWGSVRREATVVHWMASRPFAEASALWRPLVPLIVRRIEVWTLEGPHHRAFGPVPELGLGPLLHRPLLDRHDR